MGIIHSPMYSGSPWIHKQIAYSESRCYVPISFPTFYVTGVCSNGIITLQYPGPHGISLDEIVHIENPGSFETSGVVVEVPSSDSLRVDIQSEEVSDGSYSVWAQQLQPVAAAAHESVESGDILDAAEVLWNYDDNNEVNGPVHRLWSACEDGISRLSIHAGSGGITTTPTLLYTAPYPGIFRIWKFSFIVVPEDNVFSINESSSWWKIRDERLDATAVRLIANDQVWYKSEGYVFYVFCPYIWPQVP